MKTPLMLLVGALLMACAGEGEVTTSPTAGMAQSSCFQGSTVYCELNPDVTQSTIDKTICKSGWTASIRPPASFTDQLKARQLATENLPGPASGYEEDHRMPLELGGAPRDEFNLSPQPRTSAGLKDQDENRLKERVCRREITLVQAQREMVSTWLAPYPGYQR